MDDKQAYEQLTRFLDEMKAARSLIFVSVAALDAGDTDLELNSAVALKDSLGHLDGIYDEMISWRIKLSAA